MYTRAYGAESRLLTPLIDYITADAAQVETLTEFLTDKETALDEYSGLLIALARNHFDPEEDGIIDPAIDALMATPEIYKQGFLLSALTNVVLHEKGGVENLSDSEKWLKLLGGFAVAQDIPLNTLIKFLVSQDMTDLPENLQAEITGESATRLHAVRQTLAKVLEPYKRPKRYLLSEPPSRHTIQAGRTKKRNGGQKKGKSGRVTQKSAGQRSVLETVDAPTPLHTIMVGKETDTGWTTAETLSDLAPDAAYSEWAEQAIAVILEQKNFRDYVAKYNNTEDVKSMLRVILTDPKGNGSSRLLAPIKLTDPLSGRYPKRRYVMHFSPQDAMGVRLSDSRESNRTRIFYCVANKQLVLLDIQHKAGAEKIGRVFRRT